MNGTQVLLWLFVLPIPVACISWTVTHEEIFREPREYCLRSSKECKAMLARKFFYVFTCEYCFSHYITIGILALTEFRLFLPDWRGFLLAGFAVVWIANIYMSLYGFLRVDIRKERLTADIKEKEKEQVDAM